MDWPTLRGIERDADNRIIVTNGSEILCWGARDAVTSAFGDRFDSLSETDLPQDLAMSEAFAVQGFIEQALATALARDRPLLVRTRNLSPIMIVDAHATDSSHVEPLRAVLGRLTGQIAGLFAPVDNEHPEPAKIFWAEAVRIAIEQKNGSSWLIVDPDIWIWPPRARDTAREFLDEKRRDRLNTKFDRILTAWVQVLTGTSAPGTTATLSAFDLDDAVANPTFVLGNRTGFARRLVA
ncbi:hypothetical protein [Sphingomonas sp.]|uniref:hypothetical protein n=1 Tax=Sphingomonas sp. TaxID=28214 RepID=UPI003D6CF997